MVSAFTCSEPLITPSPFVFKYLVSNSVVNWADELITESPFVFKKSPSICADEETTPLGRIADTSPAVTVPKVVIEAAPVNPVLSALFKTTWEEPEITSILLIYDWTLVFVKYKLPEPSDTSSVSSEPDNTSILLMNDCTFVSKFVT